MSRRLRILAAPLLALLSACGVGGDQELRYGAVIGPGGDAAAFAPLSEYLGRRLGLPVRMVPAADGRELVRRFREGGIQLAWLDAPDGLQARRGLEGARVLAAGELDARRFAYFIAHAGSGREQHPRFPNYLRKMSFCFGPRGSLAGHLMPELLIRRQGGATSLGFFERRFAFAASEEAAVDSVESGRYQAGVVDAEIYRRRVAEGRTDPRRCRIIWKTPSWPGRHWSAGPELDRRFGTGFGERLRDALLAIEDPELLAPLGRRRLVPVGGEDLELLERLAAEPGLLP